MRTRFPRIIEAVYSRPWLIRPEQHRVIQRLLESRLAADMPMPPPGQEDEEDFSEPMPMGDALVIPVYGILGHHLGRMEMLCGGCSVDIVGQHIEAAQGDSSIGRIILDLDSPGGTVTGIPELGDRIAASAKPVYAFTSGQCCSGAYWLASQARLIYATQTAELGSIGVYSVHFDHSRELANAGVVVTTIQAGAWKTMGAPWKPLTDAEKAKLQEEVDSIYGMFKAAVSVRPIDFDDMQGQTFLGQSAVEHGLADGLIESVEAVVQLTETQPRKKL